ncbi:MAG: hypothetical protein K2X82_31745 [Gemmataceae bacterium]|nr:hypothetical protein [Gemmataceae bacterium]
MKILEARLQVVSITLIIFTAVYCPSNAPVPKNESIKGKWKLNKFAAQGKNLNIKNDCYITIDDRYALWEPWTPDEPASEAPAKFEYKLDNTTSPKSFLFNKFVAQNEFLEDEDLPWVSAYKIEAGDLVFCYDVAKDKIGELPDSFDSAKGVLRITATYKRVK